LRPDNPIGVPFIELSEVDSSNNYAMRQLQAHLAGHGSAWFVRFQSAGKGQHGKSWNAEPGQNIIMSIIIETIDFSIDKQYLISMIVALACNDFFSKYAIDSTSVKWPNDLYWKDRKAGGVLIETLIQGKALKYAVIGIGININQTFFPADLPNPVSLKQITGKSFDVTELAKELCSLLNRRWKQLKKGNEEVILEEYNNILYKRNERVTFKTTNATFNAMVKGVDINGDLLIDTGERAKVKFGTVEWLIG
jgi:BirA family biotin operon repressor/biotin-[acetyl-CoA-carboxylase] ligase